MSRGCIPVVFDRGGLSEIIENKKDGYIIDEISITSLYNTLNHIIFYNGENINNNDIQEKAKKFSIKQNINRLKEEYSKLMEKE